MNKLLPDETIVQALLHPGAYPHSATNLQLIETHISWVILTGDYAYKIKKPVNLGFLDFSTLEKRKHLCEEELRLNRRLAPSIYLDVVAITGSEEQPQINGVGEVIEYAVKMHQFPQSAQLDRMLQRGELHAQHMDALAMMVADFHAGISQSSADSSYGAPAQIFQPILDTLKTLRKYAREAKSLQLIVQLETWCQQQIVALEDVIAQRKANGFVRECHGDMHLRNLAWLDDAPLAFDCIEFNPNLSWNDVISEVAFLIMDLDARKQPQLATRFLNTYLQQTGDYAGVRLLRFYLAYRALVRAMVDAIRLGQEDVSATERKSVAEESHAYLCLASAYTRVPKPLLIITRGMSGSGKSTITLPLLERLGAIRLRSDVERKRLFGMPGQQSGREAYGQGIYSAEATERTYYKLAELVGAVLDGGYTTVVDATFKDRQQRELFYQLAREKTVTVVVLQFNASSECLRQRIQERKGDVSDADLEILEHQLSNWPLMDENEPAEVITIDTDSRLDLDRVAEQIQSYMDEL